FDATIREAVGDAAIPRPAALEGLETLPQRVQTVPNSADAVKGIIEQTLA
ncbi:TPA: threonine synthase, partial [Neisseria meningitidis]